jgi:hypothetical protein
MLPLLLALPLLPACAAGQQVGLLGLLGFGGPKDTVPQVSPQPAMGLLRPRYFPAKLEIP